MSTRQEVISRQSEWARGKGLAPDARGYLSTYGANLRQPLSPCALTCFQKGSGNELVDVGERPAKMRAVHSSSALAVNTFDYWVESPDTALQALGLPAGGVCMKFEAQFETGLGGNPPNLDVSILWADGSVLGVESKFTEWLTPKAPGKELFKPKYFPPGPGLWASRGLVLCQELAQQLQDGSVRYGYLDAAQLLKHALGLACGGKRFELYYLYFDFAGKQHSTHAAEAQDFAARIRADFPFHIATYQDVFKRLQALAPQHHEYLEYLESRYFR